jgi:hypothetical protein
VLGAVAAPFKLKIKKTDFFRYMMVLNVLCDLQFSQNQPLKVSDDYYIGILKNKIKE